MERVADAVYALSRDILGESGNPLADYDRTVLRAVERIRSNGSFTATAFPSLAPSTTVDASAAWQAALDVARLAGGVPIYVPRGTYVIASPLTWLTSVDRSPGPTIIGAGRFATIFDNRVANGAMLQVDQTASVTFAHGGRLQGFQIQTTTRPAVSDGIQLSALYQSLIEDVLITGLTGTGIVMDVNGDLDGPVHLTLDRVWLEHCDQYGLNVTNHDVASENSFLHLRSCFLQYNTLGGCRYRGLIGTFLDTAFVRNAPTGSGATFGGLQVYASTAGSSRALKLLGCDFEGNGVCHLDLQTVAGVDALGCEFLHNAGDIATNPITTGIKIGGSGLPGGAAVNVHVANSFVRNSTSGYVHVAVGSDAVDTVVEGTRWDVFDTGTQTKITDSGTGTCVTDDGIAYRGAVSGTGAVRGDVVLKNTAMLRGKSGAAAGALIGMSAASHVQIGESGYRIKLDVASATHHNVVATASLPAAGAAEDGRILIEDGGAGNRNLILYAGGERFRIDGGAAF